MLHVIYLLFIESVIILAVRCANTEIVSFIYNDNLDGEKCNEAELMFIKLDVSRIRCSAQCTDVSQCKSIFYNDQTRSCIGCTGLYTSASSVVAEPGTKYFGIKIDETLLGDCKEILESNPNALTGVYSILPPGQARGVSVLCDMDTDGGGWTVFQHRFDGTVNFERLMADYVNGFGSPHGEYWLGLELIRSLTKNKTSTIHVEFVDADDAVAIEIGTRFKIGDAPYYRFHVGPAVFFNDSNDEFILQRLDRRKFTTIDQDNDGADNINCAEKYKSGWWFNWCTFINVNGEYITPGTVSTHWEGRGGMVHEIWRDRAALKGTKLMFRRDT